MRWFACRPEIWFPVERKMGRAPRRPYRGDVLQAAAYCVLIEEHYGRMPPFMRIQYADRCFDEPYTTHARKWVLRMCERVRLALQAVSPACREVRQLRLPIGLRAGALDAGVNAVCLF
jgi:hypothetical protein